MQALTQICDNKSETTQPLSSVPRGAFTGVKHFCKQTVSADGTALQFLQSSGRLFDGLPRRARRRDLQVGGLHAPDLGGVLCNGSIAGELPSGGDVLDHHLCPLLLIL